MPQIMAEAFARSLIDKIMLEAFDVVDLNDEKLRMLDNRQELASIESQATRTTLQMHDRSPNELETTALIEKMVRGLHNLQIGDSTSVSSSLSALEKQVKHIVYNIDDISQADGNNARVTQGQGDVHQIVHDAVIETTSDPTRARHEKESNEMSEATKVSVNLLHRMIEELETKVEETSNLKENDPTCTSKERIAAWEETEEQFIRIIESVDEADLGNAVTLSESNSRSNTCVEVAPLSTIHSAPFVGNVSLKEVSIEEIVSSPLPSDDVRSSTATLGRSRKKSRDAGASSGNQKKRNILDRMRRLFRTIFGRRKK